MQSPACARIRDAQQAGLLRAGQRTHLGQLIDVGAAHDLVHQQHCRHQRQVLDAVRAHTISHARSQRSQRRRTGSSQHTHAPIRVCALIAVVEVAPLVRLTAGEGVGLGFPTQDQLSVLCGAAKCDASGEATDSLVGAQRGPTNAVL